MSDRLRLTILGCSSSPGVPRINGDWGACDPTNPKNRRRRCAALIERLSEKGKTVAAIDCGPDFREQMLSAEVKRLDGVVLTHPHADHIHGVDDLRNYMLVQRERIPVHADEPTYERLYEAFGYCFTMPAGSSYPPVARWVEIKPGEPFAIDGAGGPIRFEAFRQVHGSIHSLGFRIGPFAYCSDVSDFPDAAVATIQGARHIVIDALQYERHPSHLSLDQALEWLRRFRPEGATLTHMHTPLDYEAVRRRVPEHIQPAYDGLQIELPIDV